MDFPVETYPKNVLLLGVSDGGPTLEPTLILSQDHAESVFTSGELVDQFGAVNPKGFGLTGVWMMRLNRDQETLDDPNRLDRIETALGQIAGTPFHIIVPLGLAFDHATLDVASVLLTYLSEQNGFRPALAILKVNALTNSTDVTQLVSHPRLSAIQSKEPHQLVLVAGAAQIDWNTPSARSADPAAAVAGLIASLKLGESATNKALPQLNNLAVDLSATDRSTLATAGISVMTKTTRNGIVLARAVTASQDAFHDLKSQMTVQYVIDYVLMTAEDYLGGPIQSAAAFKRRIQDFFAAHQDVILDAQIELIPDESVLDAVELNLFVTMAGETLEIRLPVTLKGASSIV